MEDETMIAEGDGFYFYRESSDEEQVFLKIFGDIEFTATQKSVTVKIPIAVWEFIRQTGAARFGLIEKSDAELVEMIESEIDQKRAEFEKRADAKNLKGDGRENCFKVIRSLRYAKPDEPREQQIEKGLAHHRKERARQQEILRVMEDFRVSS